MHCYILIDMFHNNFHSIYARVAHCSWSKGAGLCKHFSALDETSIVGSIWLFCLTHQISVEFKSTIGQYMFLQKKLFFNLWKSKVFRKTKHILRNDWGLYISFHNFRVIDKRRHFLYYRLRSYSPLSFVNSQRGE